ncbi:MAG: hypothetical protein ABSH00_09410 [Bryobacteraceae bacterium]|jgi:hypothetical protein
MRAATFLLLSLAAAGFAQNFAPRLTGEVSRGQEFQREIGSGLLFQLKPTDEAGWMIRIVPKVFCSEAADFASVVNAPYRNYNSLHVDASYGISASEAVEKMGPREFRFVLTCEDYELESRRLEIVLWGYTHSQQEIDEALAKLGTSPLGRGKLTILESKVSPAEHDIQGKNYGKIDWLKFRLDITFPAARGTSGAIYPLTDTTDTSPVTARSLQPRR